MSAPGGEGTFIVSRPEGLNRLDWRPTTFGVTSKKSIRLIFLRGQGLCVRHEHRVLARGFTTVPLVFCPLRRVDRPHPCLLQQAQDFTHFCRTLTIIRQEQLVFRA